MKLLPIGLSDYKRLIEDDYYYVDKTLLIQELRIRGGIVTLIPRPRRFGKTLNLSMLRYFYEKTEKSNAHLFEDKKIWNIPEMAKLQGKFPVIFVTFKDVKESDWEVTKGKLIDIIAREYARHDYLLETNILKDYEKEAFQNICAQTGTSKDYHNSLRNLSDFLERYHQEKVVVLIDEYDSPVHAGYQHNYYNNIIEFMRGLLCGVLKDNSSLERSVITGILRTAKEGIFSGLNNLEVATILNQNFSDKFGFTQQEIDRMLADYQLEQIAPQFKDWYNGYLIGETKIYNPWSALNCVKSGGSLIPYWVNTSDNGLIRTIIAQASPQIKEACAQLVQGNALPEIQIDDKMVLPGMSNDANSIWSLLLFSGYVTISNVVINARGHYICSLVLPNKELLSLFDTLISDLFRQSLGYDDVRYLEQALREADGKLFGKLLAKFMIQSMSFHDVDTNEPEKSYHLFALGLLVVLSNNYAVRSNRESGYGRYDIMLIPHAKTLPGVIIEFKKFDSDEDETMQECADRALEQIQKRDYAAELRSQGVEKIAFFGIACHKKDILLKQA
jgi:hypothetical protein